MIDQERIILELNKRLIKIFGKDNSGHDIYHLERTRKNALHIQEKEGGNRLTIGVSAYVHDVHRIIELSQGKYCSPKDSLPQVQEILHGTGLSPNQIRNILHCVEFHEEYCFSEKGKTVDDIETLILQDADNLDALGPIGIARTFMFAGAHKRPMYDPDIPFDRGVYEESVKDLSTIHHFYSKLLKLKDNMNTFTGKQLAEPLHNDMLYFIEMFQRQWKCNY